MTDKKNEPGVRGELDDDRFVGNADLISWQTRLGRTLVEWAGQLIHRLGPHVGLALILLIGAVIASAATFGAARVYDAVTESDGVAGLDHPVLLEAMRLRSPALNGFATLYTDVGGVIIMPIIAILAVVILTLQRRAWTPAILIVGAAVGSLLMTVAGKDLFGRTRPPLSDAVPPYEYSPSFPSGHTLNATVIAGVIAYIIILRQSSKIARMLTVAVAVIFALTIGLSRIYLGHHWFTDVIAAWLLGVAWLSVVITAHRLYLTTRHKEVDRAVPDQEARNTRPTSS